MISEAMKMETPSADDGLRLWREGLPDWESVGLKGGKQVSNLLFGDLTTLIDKSNGYAFLDVPIVGGSKTVYITQELLSSITLTPTKSIAEYIFVVSEHHYFLWILHEGKIRCSASNATSGERCKNSVGGTHPDINEWVSNLGEYCHIHS